MKRFLNLFAGVFITALAVGFLVYVGPVSSQGSEERTITVTYDPNGDPSHPDTGPFIFDPYELVIEHGASNVPIRLEIVSEGYSFPGDAAKAITIHPDDGNFRIQGIGANNTRIMIMDFNREDRIYKYDVMIVNNQTRQVYLIDPRIKNGGGGTTD